jgi:2-C-methyl-D-erythritol 2,4-cyclodiphosphate synthase
MRIGLGYDIHRLVSGRKLYLGGVEIDYPKGLLGHSDGDCVLHALCDGLLGAAGLGDIGEHFPDTSAEWKDVRSTIILEKVLKMVKGEGFQIQNVDVTIYAEKPKLAPHKSAIRKNLASLLGLEEEKVNIKAKTLEGLGLIGREEAIASHVALVLEGNVTLETIP